MSSGRSGNSSMSSNLLRVSDETLKIHSGRVFRLTSSKKAYVDRKSVNEIVSGPAYTISDGIWGMHTMIEYPTFRDQRLRLRYFMISRVYNYFEVMFGDLRRVSDKLF